MTPSGTAGLSDRACTDSGLRIRDDSGLGATIRSTPSDHVKLSRTASLSGTGPGDRGAAPRPAPLVFPPHQGSTAAGGIGHSRLMVCSLHYYMRLGLREANQRFSKAIRAVRAGRDVVLTERGHPIAVIKPLKGQDVEETTLRAMVDEGFVPVVLAVEVGLRCSCACAQQDSAAEYLAARERQSPEPFSRL
jgi:prevent-host-death family protein